MLGGLTNKTMTEEDKKLLLKDLCARLPYGVKINVPLYYEVEDANITLDAFWLYDIQHGRKEIRPYLRPMSSMTDEEKMEVGKLRVCYDGAFHNDIYDTGIFMEEAFTAISWLLERHFDINYLIEKGLALDAPDSMY